MANTSIKLDTRSVKKDGTSPIVALISVGAGKSFRLPLGISISSKEWDIAKGSVKSGLNKLSYNLIIARAEASLKAKLIELDIEGRLDSIEMANLKILLKKTLHGQADDNSPRIAEMFDLYMEGLQNTSTRQVYDLTKRKILEFYGDILLSSINVAWLKDFERKLMRTYKKNSINIQMRNLRAIINDAINRELLTNYTYPFRIYKLPKEQTAKRDLSIDDIRTIRDYDAEPEMRKYLDFFMLSFYLGGINAGDLCLLTHKDYYNGRIVYRRQKTKGHPISIRVEPEAQALLDKYKGAKYLLNYCDNSSDYHTWLRRVDRKLKEFGPYTLGKHGKKLREPLYPFLSTYYARHSFATIASEDCDISLDVIGRILGHAEKSVTDIYIHRKTKKMDEALRKVLDAIK